MFRRLVAFALPYRGLLGWGLAATVALAALSVLPPFVMRAYYSRVIEKTEADPDVVVTVLPWVLLAMFAIPFATNVLDRLNGYILTLAGTRFVTDIRNTLMRRILVHDMRFHGETLSGSLVGRLMDDVSRMSTLMTTEAMRTVIDIVIFLFSVGVVFYLSWILGIVLVVMLVGYGLAYRHFAKKIRRASRSWRHYFDLVNGRLQENLAGARAIRIYNREDGENDLFIDRQTTTMDRALDLQTANVGLGVACSFIAGIGSTIIAALGVLMALYADKTDFHYPDVLAVDMFVWMAVNPSVRLTNMAGQLADVFVSVGRVLDIIEDPPKIVSPPGAPDLPDGPGAVEFDRIEFAYDPAKPLYRGLSLSVKAGQTIALVGHTGCGKTSLTTVLMRYYDLTGGAIRIDGADIRAVKLESLRRAFGVVLQDPVIFEGTVRENIAYGRPDAHISEIEAAARAAEIHDTVVRLPDGYDTVLGTLGLKLSVGQKQRLSIARAILTDPRILVMDEATSSLDSESEALIQKALARLLKGRTSFVVAHRLSTIRNADAIVVMDQGAIVEQGTHAELMAIPGGRYRHLYEEMLGAPSNGDGGDDPRDPNATMHGPLFGFAPPEA